MVNKPVPIDNSSPSLKIELLCHQSMLVELFLFFFKGNQERANEQLGKIEGTCCLKKYSLISEMKVLNNYE